MRLGSLLARHIFAVLSFTARKKDGLAAPFPSFQARLFFSFGRASMVV